MSEDYLFNSTYAFSENKLINGIELEGAEQIPTVDKFEYTDNNVMNGVTVVNNTAISTVNGGIELWNSFVSSTQTVWNEGWGSYFNKVGDDFSALGSSIKNYAINQYDYLTNTSFSQQASDTYDAFMKAESYEAGFGFGIALFGSKNFFSTSQFSKSVSFMEANPGTAVPRGNGKFYSVAFEMELPKNLYPGKRYDVHFKAANEALDAAIRSDATFAQSMNSLGIVIPRSPTGRILGKSPLDWVWHHDVGPGVMQLVPKSGPEQRSKAHFDEGKNFLGASCYWRTFQCTQYQTSFH